MYNDNNSSMWGRENIPNDRPADTHQEPELNGKARIKVIGVGGAGNNAVNRMIDAGITSAKYVAVNTDAQILACNKAETKIQIGAKLTKGLGAGADPEIGRMAAEEDKDVLVKAVENTDLLFITAGMGGGTGTGAAPVIAKIAKDLKILTVAVVTEPFSFEGKHRMDNTAKGLDNLKKYVDTLIIIPNEKIGDVVPKNAPMQEALRVADEVLKQGIRGIADLIVTPALINLDFADVKAVLKDRGLAHMGVGVAKGENRIIEAVRLAVSCPLLETTIEGATGVILNIVGGNDLTFDEVRLAANLIHSVVDYSANIIFGACIDENIRDEVEVTVIATGFPSSGIHPELQKGARISRQPAYNLNQVSNQQQTTSRSPFAPQPPRQNPPVDPYGQPPRQNPPADYRPDGQYRQNPPADPYAQPRQNPADPYGQPRQNPPTQYRQDGLPQNPPADRYRQPAQPQKNFSDMPPASSVQRGAPQQGYYDPRTQGYPQQQGQGYQQPQQGYPQGQNYPRQAQYPQQQPQNYPQQPQQGYPQQQPQQEYNYSRQESVPGYDPYKNNPPAPHAEAEDDDADIDMPDQKLPDFVKKLIGKKK